ncbi:ATP-binding cassette domain-containing protein [Heliobacillus mobilis]|uniref:ATP-binding cassette domain-containing protein n=1 Tax=Heliobacterium mobile TaxID=28064 RepID=A0A6I3SRK7_HELMO|nr:energy-coupling factor transporter ATPase [Heliobacterium mobile]MTV51002.1 ATP-binding cassette domain-containing protein [Heliobacterium mobile]
MTNAIEIQNLTYRYPHAVRPSLVNLNLTVESGKFIAIMGPTGAGKSTLCLCLNGLIPQLIEGELTGNVALAGKDTQKFRVQTLARRLGLVMQEPETQIFGQTVAEDVAFGPCNFSLPASEVQARVREALASVRLTGYEPRHTEELSGGEKQRLAIAGLLAQYPEILVLDEPAAELDPQGRQVIYETLDALRKERVMTIIVVEPNGEDILERADEVIVLREGEIAWQGEPDRLFRDLSLVKRLGLRPIPLSLVGSHCFKKGWICQEEIPLTLSAAVPLFSQPHMKELMQCNLDDIFYLKSTNATKNQQNSEDVAAIEIRQLFYRYESGQLALQGVDLAARQGEFVAFVGQNGAGKTTLAKHLNGLLKPTSGEVLVHGKSTQDIPTSQLAHRVGYVFQNPDHQIFALTVEKEVEYGLSHLTLTEAEIGERVSEALQLTGLESRRSVHPLTLGKGERQMLALASILALRPKILVIDEPTTGLDDAGVGQVMALIKRLHEEGTTVIMVSHDMELVAQYAERVVVLYEGTVLMDGSSRDVLRERKILAQAAVIPPQRFLLREALFGQTGSIKQTEPVLQTGTIEHTGSIEQTGVRELKEINESRKSSLHRENEPTYLSRLDIRTKMAGFLGIVITSFVFQDPLSMLALFTVVAALATLVKSALVKSWETLKPLLPLFGLIVIMTAFTYPQEQLPEGIYRTVLLGGFMGEGWGATVGGLFMGLTYMLRIAIMVIISVVLMVSTPFDDFLQFLRKLQVPSEVSFMLVTAIRFIPTLDKKRRMIMEAQSARGAEWHARGLLGPIRTFVPLFVPLIINAITMAERLSMAMLNRGYGYNRTPTVLREIEMAPRDYLWTALCISVAAVAIYLHLSR